MSLFNRSVFKIKILKQLILYPLKKYLKYFAIHVLQHTYANGKMILLLRYIVALCGKKGYAENKSRTLYRKSGEKQSGIILRVRWNDLEKNSGINSTLTYAWVVNGLTASPASIFSLSLSLSLFLFPSIPIDILLFHHIHFYYKMNGLHYHQIVSFQYFSKHF